MYRSCESQGIQEIQQLEYGMDFRKPEYRRECFLRFYQFHLKYKSHPGCVYSILPFLFKYYNFTDEQKLWFCFINGNTQNPITSLAIFDRFRDFEDLKINEMEAWFQWHYPNLYFDLDRRHHKKNFVKAVESYQDQIGKASQASFFEERKDFWFLDALIKKDFYSFGRLSTFSYMEYLKIAGLLLTCPTLFLEDINGSHSQRNGLCIVLGRDDLDWNTDDFDIKIYDEKLLQWLIVQGDILLMEARQRMKNEPYIGDVSHFTLESALCAYKSFHRPNRRYPNVYMDMFHLRLEKAMPIYAKNKYVLDPFSEWRNTVPNHLRTECNPKDQPLSKLKQNWYLRHGQLVMMDKEDIVFKNGYNDMVDGKEEELFQ